MNMLNLPKGVSAHMHLMQLKLLWCNLCWSKLIKEQHLHMDQVTEQIEPEWSSLSLGWSCLALVNCYSQEEPTTGSHSNLALGCKRLSHAVVAGHTLLWPQAVCGLLVQPIRMPF